MLAVAGCGGGGDSESDGFAKGYNATIRRLASVNQELAGLDVSAKSSRAIAREFDRFGDALASTRGELARLEPPASARSEFNALLGALDDSVTASRREVDAAQDALGRAVQTG